MMRQYPAPERDRLPKIGWRGSTGARALVLFAGQVWNGKGLSARLGSSIENVYRWARQKRHGIALKE